MQKQNTDLQFDDDVKFHERAHKVTQSIIILMGLFVLAGLFGIFGYSFWTRQTEGDPSNLKIEYEIFLRGKRETPLVIFARSNNTDSFLDLYVSTPYFEKAEIKDLVPKPASITLLDAWYVLTYPVRGKGTNKLVINTMPVKAGAAKLIVKLKEKEVTIHQFIYP